MKNHYLNSSVITVIAVLFILFIAAGCSVLLEKQYQNKESPDAVRIAPQTYLSQEECEQATGKSCGIAMCDVIPEGKTFEEVCGRGFRSGWQPMEENADVDTSIWQTYRNEQYGFEVKYPSEWKIINSDSGDIYAEFESAETAGVAIPNSKVTNKYFYNVSVVIDNPGWQYGTLASAEKILSVAGEQASQYKLKGDLSIGCWSEECTQTSFVKNGKQYSIIFDGGTRNYIDGKLSSTYGSGPSGNELEKYQKIYNQILSTFKFIEPLTSASNAGWYQCTQDSDCTAVYALNDVCQNNCPTNAINRSYLPAYNQERAKQVQLKKQLTPGVACPELPPPTAESCIQYFPTKCAVGACKIVQFIDETSSNSSTPDISACINEWKKRYVNFDVTTPDGFTKVYEPGKLQVSFKDGTTEASARVWLDSLGLSYSSIYMPGGPAYGVVVSTPQGQELGWICKLQNAPLVKLVEPIFKPVRSPAN
ncbi:MAG: hypothetical protein WC575_02625 [Patescibacteria group bacterium]